MRIGIGPERQCAKQRHAVRHRQGLADFLPVLDAERSLYAADDKLAQTDRDEALALVTLYKSLGGGWQMPEREDQHAAVAEDSAR
ncbi:TolC family protein [Paraburkholderia lacunae]|uniref:Transporter n=1 Tax=Paraburkholderia lacunae TaxID=2211104 RepID=A0A370MXZ2_9BURK|nr:TolC family protein [Paraburkholderia lacunae]RDJ98186.1 hypothetical protein DLM46_34610 [Paraburkholderia lacunae]